MRFQRSAGALLAFALAFALISAAPASHSFSLAGTLTNTTADISAQARLIMQVEGESVTATLKTEAPLSGSGKLEGKFRHGWLELTGKLDEGLTLQLRGVLNASDFRGTYIAGVPGSPIQYGKFQLALAAAPAR